MVKESYVIAMCLFVGWPLTGCSNEGAPASGVPGDESPPGAIVSSLPQSDAITGVHFKFGSLTEAAEGSDNWAVTWAEDDSQYVTWGDGGGFDGSNSDGRVSMGLARIEGGPEDFIAVNVWGGNDPLAEATFSGKSYGILAVRSDLWLWRTGDGSEKSAFHLQDLFVSRDDGLNFDPTGVSFTSADFGDTGGFFAPTYLQFGRGYSGARDEYVYIYAPEKKSDEWEVQKPGEISLLRVPATRLAERAAYEFFSGRDANGAPTWSGNVLERAPAFADAVNGVMRTSVTYNAGLGRYLLITQQHTRQRGGYIGIYESEAPWGPWRTVLFEDAWELGLQDGSKSVYWNFSNKWTSADGRRSALVYTGTGADNFGVIMVEFDTALSR